MTNTLRIDRRYRGVGRIARSSGTDHPATHRRVLGMLEGLHSIGRLDLMADIRDGVRSGLEVLYFYERQQLDRLPTKETAGDLATALWNFQKTHDCGDSHRANIACSIRHIERLLPKNVPVGELPKFVRLAKAEMRETPVAFNRLRSQMLAFASESQGKMSPLWLGVLQVNRFKKVEGKRPKSRLRRPLTVKELDAVMSSFSDYSFRRGNANKLTVFCRPVCSEQFYRDRFAAATMKALGEELDMYSLRRTFATWCESSRIETSRARAYLAHGAATVTDIYLKTNVLPFVIEDSRVVAVWIETERARARSV